MKSTHSVCTGVLICLTISASAAPSDEKDTEFWLQKGQLELSKQINKKPNLNFAKNVIFFLGDGMSIPTLTAARAYKGLLEGRVDGEGDFLSFEKFPYSGLSRTYCVDNKVADSACSATAFLRGVKANKGTIGVNGQVSKGDCDAARNVSNRVDSIATWAQQDGCNPARETVSSGVSKIVFTLQAMVIWPIGNQNDSPTEKGRSAGFVTMTAVTDATPAGTFVYTAERDWECDADVKAAGKDPEKCEDVAKQLILRNPGKDFNVIMGGGARYFIPKNETDEEKNSGRREDGRHLIKMWIKDKQSRNEEFAYVWNRAGLLALPKIPKYLLGLFGPGNMDYNINKNKRQPSLAEMTKAAIKVLQKNKKGYFLLVEGGIIDTAHHASKAHVSLDETVEFSKAVEMAVNMTNEEDTLIVVTADHAHTLSINGYPDRQKSIFGFSGSGIDGLPYSILSYANGHGFKIKDGKRHDMTKDNTEQPHYVFPSGVPLHSETHGGDDVAVFARGPHSHIFTGSYEESYIAVAMGYASGLLGSFK